MAHRSADDVSPDNTRLVAEDLEDLIDDYRYRREELQQTDTAIHRARCYLELVYILRQFRELAPRLESVPIEPCCREILQDALSHDAKQFHHDALWYLLQSCEQLFSLLSYAVELRHSEPSALDQPEPPAVLQHTRPERG